jgi:D-tyrosyl-tRNA(Tyr) deacylase
MIIVLQRVKEAWVESGGRTKGRIGRGICLLVGIEKGDTREDSEFLARKATELRIFPDSEGRMNLSLSEADGDVLAVSQFTLAGSIKKGRRPSFDRAEEPGEAEALFEDLIARIRQKGFRVETGVFQAEMNVHISNDGPVTFVLESRKTGEKGKDISR